MKLDFKELSKQCKTDIAGAVKAVIDGDGVELIYLDGSGASVSLRHCVLTKIWNDALNKESIREQTGLDDSKLGSMSYRIKKPQTSLIKKLEEGIKACDKFIDDAPDKQEKLQEQLAGAEPEQKKTFTVILNDLKKKIVEVEKSKALATNQLEKTSNFEILKSFRGSRGATTTVLSVEDQIASISKLAELTAQLQTI